MKVGFTGSRHGMTMGQAFSVTRLMAELNPDEVHHGDCVGSDATFHAMCRYVDGIDIVIHPPTAAANRAWCQGAKEIKPPFDYLVRDQHIVDEVDTLVATPHHAYELMEPRSGTWATVRKARKKGMPIYIIVPSGEVVKEN